MLETPLTLLINNI